MICQRCGFCCLHLDVMIINPRSIRSDGTIDPEDRNSMIKKQKGEKCPHLAHSGEVAVCTIHDLPCYRVRPATYSNRSAPRMDPASSAGTTNLRLYEALIF